MELAPIKQMLVRHEAVRDHPYLDCCSKYWRDCACEKKGKLTIGIGRNLDDVGVFKDEIDLMCTNNILGCVDDLTRHIPWWMDLDATTKMVLIDMTFQMGIFGLLNFEHFLKFLKEGKRPEAARALLDSLYAHQTPARAQENAALIKG